MFFAIEHVPVHDGCRARITLGGDRYEFSMLMPWDDLRDVRGREIVTAWALGLFTMVGSGINHRVVDELLDHLDQRFPVEKPIFRRPKLRLW